MFRPKIYIACTSYITLQLLLVWHLSCSISHYTILEYMGAIWIAWVGAWVGTCHAMGGHGCNLKAKCRALLNSKEWEVPSRQRGHFWANGHFCTTCLILCPNVFYLNNTRNCFKTTFRGEFIQLNWIRIWLWASKRVLFFIGCNMWLHLEQRPHLTFTRHFVVA